MISLRSSLATVLALIAAYAGVPLVAACASAPQPPARTSPLSPEAEEPPAPRVATSLREDPLAAPPPPAAGGHEHHDHHHHSGSAAASGDEARAAGETYVCPMHPEVKQATPGKCPKCGMKLVLAPKPGPGAASSGVTGASPALRGGDASHVHEHHAH